MHYREEEIEEELLEEDHDSGILGELQTEADSYSSGSDSGNFSRVFFVFCFQNLNQYLFSGYGLTTSNQSPNNRGRSKLPSHLLHRRHSRASSVDRRYKNYFFREMYLVFVFHEFFF